MIKALRTPTSQFANLPDYPFAPHYVEIDDGLQMHFVDEGPRDADVVLLLHGEPSWSYLYRKMIPVFVKAGYRAIAPDLVGFGKSDKPEAREDYTYQSHVKWMTTFVEKLKLQKVTLFVQDWGGLIGLRIATTHADMFDRIVAANTFLPAGYAKFPDAFEVWKNFSQTVPVFPVGNIIDRGTTADLSPEVIAAYNAPFPDESYKAGARQFPAIVPTASDDPEALANREHWAILDKWEKPFLTLFSDNDPITKGAEKVLMKRIPGAQNQPHEIIESAGHFLQEEKGEEIAEKMVRWMAGA